MRTHDLHLQAGALTPIAGFVTGLVNPIGYKTLLYVRDAGGVNYWVKPQAGSSFPLDDTGVFNMAGWSSSPFDTGTTQFAIVVVPAGALVVSSEFV